MVCTLLIFYVIAVPYWKHHCLVTTFRVGRLKTANFHRSTEVITVVASWVRSSKNEPKKDCQRAALVKHAMQCASGWSLRHDWHQYHAGN